MAVAQEIRRADGTTRSATDIIAPWRKRVDNGRKDRRRYELQWMINQNFAAGKQWLRYSKHDHRVIERRTDDRGRQLLTAETLGQHIDTVVGKLAADDFRPELLLGDEGEIDELYAEQLNLAYAWGWDEEWKGDRKLMMVLRELAASTGTAALWCCYNRQKGSLLAESHPHLGGKPLLNDAERAQAMDASVTGQGPKVSMLPLREGQVEWRFLSGWNLLPPPGVIDPADFPYDLIVRPVYLPDLVAQYGDKAKNVAASDVRAMDHLGQDSRELDQGAQSPSSAGKLEDHAFVYTGYQKPNGEYPNGHTIVFAEDNTLLAYDERLPYNDAPYGPRTGVTYFRWEILSQRFWARAFVERAIDPQKTKNKRVTQQDEIIDRGMPTKYIERGSVLDIPTGEAVGIIEVEQGAPLPKTDPGIGPGPHFQADIQLQDELIEKALGLHAVSLGGAPPGVSAYSALALQTEQDATKLDPIAGEFHLSVADLGRDTYEAMRQWGPQKQLLIAGDDDRLQALVFNAVKMPPGFKVRPAKGSALPRSQAAEVQKIADLWNAAIVCGAVQGAPQDWLEWYKRSLDAGKAEEMPHRDQSAEQQHKAALENVVMLRTGQPVPVAPYDDPNIHVPEHRQAQMDADERASLGDADAPAQQQALAQHIQMHLEQAQQNAVQTGQAAAVPGQPQPAGAPDAQDAQAQAFAARQAVRHENSVIAPLPPNVRG